MASRAAVRASDADREHVADRLRRAAAEGRILTEELEQRLEAALSARTYGQLNALIADLPGRSLGLPSPRRAPTLLRPVVAIPIALAITLVAILLVFIVTGVLAGWMLWIVVGWWFFGRRGRRLHAARSGRSLHACGGWHRGERLSQSR
ncbi:MAG TPA: DUF1707 domain-containing protein [Solirubrobacteraceae bacterium]|jgi:hypothetical protein|nr:DUF1707 domain-containing protein [Solirubrobacteraceae bacterium]